MLPTWCATILELRGVCLGLILSNFVFVASLTMAPTPIFLVADTIASCLLGMTIEMWLDGTLCFTISYSRG